MSAEIIQFGTPRRIVPIVAADKAVRDQRVDRRPADLLEAREARSAAWRKVDAERRYLRARLDFLDAVFFAHRAGVLIVDDREAEMFPVEESPYLEEHHRLVDLLLKVTEIQIRLPAAVSQHANWKRSFALGGGFPKVTMERSLIEEYIEADEAFLKACPRKPRSRTGETRT
jgi:hypothetical protein